jgi:polyisoprenoid-binding protein YceI
MKLFLLLSLVSFSAMASSSNLKFKAKTNSPGIFVKGALQNSNINVDFNSLESTKFGFDVMDLSTGIKNRDKHLHEKVFHTLVPGIARIEFAISKLNCPKSSSNEVECECIGNLKIKDVSNEIKFNALINKSSQVIDGKTLISLNQFKLNVPSFMGINVLDNVEVSFNVNAK